MKWIFVDDQMPNENEYVLCKCGEDSPVGITKFEDGEWETNRRPIFQGKEKYITSASPSYWMPLP